MSDGSRHVASLLHDDALVVRAESAVLPLVSRWLPLHAPLVARDHTVADEHVATIDVTVRRSDEPNVPRADPLVIVFGGVRVLRDPGDVLALTTTSRARGWIDLAARRATIEAPSGDDGRGDEERVEAAVYSMLTLSAAFLLGRIGGALVHAGGIVDPEGRAWLLIGDTHAGKTTTTVSLVAEGWRFLGDDQVVLRANGDGTLDVQGWPRHAHLDEGWAESAVTGSRAAVDLRAQWGDRWLSRAPLGGLLLPTVRASEPTSAARVDAATAFTALVRQSPWLIADRGAAPAVMALLRDASAQPAYGLSLGRDGYARGDVLAACLAPARAAADGIASRAPSR